MKYKKHFRTTDQDYNIALSLYFFYKILSFRGFSNHDDDDNENVRKTIV